MVQHIHAFTIHVHRADLLKGVLLQPQLQLIPDKGETWASASPVDGPARGDLPGSAWDHVFLGLFWNVTTPSRS